MILSFSVPPRPGPEEARRRVGAILEPLGLVYNLSKTRVVCLARGQGGFDFLGYHHHKTQSWRRPGHWYLKRWPSERAMGSIRAKVKEATGRHLLYRPVEEVVGSLNRILRGWGNYFRWGNSREKFWAIDFYVYERLERFMRAKHGPRGHFGRRRFHAVFPKLGVYRLVGTQRPYLVHA